MFTHPTTLMLLAEARHRDDLQPRRARPAVPGRSPLARLRLSGLKLVSDHKQAVTDAP